MVESGAGQHAAALDLETPALREPARAYVSALEDYALTADRIVAYYEDD